MGMNSKFWKNKTVLITGHTGFKGSWLSLWLKLLGAKVIGVSLEPPTYPNIFEKALVEEEMISLIKDVRDGEEIKKIFKEFQPEVVFHMAAQPLVRYSYTAPVETYETNVMGTLHVLEGIRAVNSVKVAVMITTDKCYENKEWEWGYRENEPMGGHDPYSSSKGAAELLIASYRDSYFPTSTYDHHETAISSVRAGNVIGGGDWADDRLIPDVIRAFQNADSVKIRNPAAIRPWPHVLEPLSGYMELAERMSEDGKGFSQAWNFGPRDEDARTVQWIVEKMSNLWGEGASLDIDNDDHPHEANYLKLDCSKAHSKLGWSPKWELDYALQKIVEWHKLEQEEGDIVKITIDQIKEYMSQGNSNE